MELEVAKKLISKYITGHGYFVSQAEIAERYYNNDNDIHYREPKNREEPTANKPIDNPMRSADNKIALGFYPLLVDQKVAYMFTAPPVASSTSSANFWPTLVSIWVSVPLTVMVRLTLLKSLSPEAVLPELPELLLPQAARAAIMHSARTSARIFFTVVSS